jgi:hypothetical protein
MKRYLIFSLFLPLLILMPSYAGDRYSYRQQYGYNKVKVIQKVIEFDADVFEPEYGYYDHVPDKIRAQKEYEDAKFKEELQALMLILLKEKVSQMQPMQQEPKQEPSLDDKVLSIFERNKCVTCHDETNSGNVQLVKSLDEGYELLDSQLATRVLVHNSTYGVDLGNKKLMPLNGEPLGDEDVEILRKWMVQKAETVR